MDGNNYHKNLINKKNYPNQKFVLFSESTYILTRY